MKIIKVPRVPKRAFNKARRPSDLLRRQMDQLEHVVAMVAGPGTLTSAAKKVRTEGQAAAFIAAATRVLHPEGAPPVPAAPARTPRRKKAATTKVRRAKGTAAPKSGRPRTPRGRKR